MNSTTGTPQHTSHPQEDPMDTTTPQDETRPMTEAEQADRARLEEEVARRKEKRERAERAAAARERADMSESDRAAQALMQSTADRVARLRAEGAILPDDDEHPSVVATRQEKHKANLTADVAENGVQELDGWAADSILSDPLRKAVEGFARNAINDGPYRTLVLFGPSGRGKTVAALTSGRLIVNNSGLSVRFVSHMRWVNMQKPNAALPHGMTLAAFRHRYLSCDVLILDDLAAGKDPSQGAREFEVNATYELINERVNSPGKRTIVTTNLGSDLDIGTIFGDATRSRLLMRAVPQLVDGPDLRQPITFGR